MANRISAKHEAWAGVIKAIAHPSRLFILEELSRGEKCVNDLTAMIGVDTSTVSKHLSVLKNAGIVTLEKRGNAVYYSLRVPCIMEFIGCVENVLSLNAKEHLKIMKCCRK